MPKRGKNWHNDLEIRQKRLVECMERYHVKNKDIVEKCNIDGSNVTKYIQGRLYLSDEKARQIRDECFPDVNIEYLYGYKDAYITDEDKQKDLLAKRDAVSRITMEANQATQVLLQYALNGVYLDEELTRLKTQGLSEKEALKKLANVSPPENLISPADALFLSLQLQEEAEKLIWSYLHRKTSPLWNFMDKDKP